MNKKELSETDIRTKYITPAIKAAGWDINSQIREEYTLTKGRIIVKGKDAKHDSPLKSDYVLFYRPNIPLAVIEAKSNRHAVTDGIQQALKYAELLDVPFVFSSNGDAFIFHDKTAVSGVQETELLMTEFPSPQTLWKKYQVWHGLAANTENILLQDYHEADKTPRYYQINAINRVAQKIANGDNRVLLVMATGTGKTYTAFQIIWRLWKAGAKKRILFLADRDLLLNQTKVNDFRPFGSAMSRLSSKDKTLDRTKGWADTSYEIYLALYQSLTGPEKKDKAYRLFKPDFFDLIVVDECHRGSADADSAWHEILKYFSTATQLGMTATPKETQYTSNISYFGEPAYVYSLKQGIQDGFLAPYKVIKVHIDIDIEGYRPKLGDTDRDGEEIEDRIYATEEFDRNIVLDDRTNLVAKKISDYLRSSGNRMQKTIIFCVDTEHAARMRQALVNENADMYSKNNKYVMRITGNDPTGYEQLDRFCDTEELYPVLVTTSRLLSTGVDVPTCRLIVLDRAVGSMTEFKQIVGRGTRLHDDSGKLYFTLIDFRQATNHFADPDFDGEPVQIYEPGEHDPIMPPDEMADDGELSNRVEDNLSDGCYDPESKYGATKKIYIDEGKTEVEIIGERIQYLNEHGKLITEDLRRFSRGRVLGKYATLTDFLTRWNDAERKKAVLEELENAGLPYQSLAAQVGDNLDPFDLVCHIAYDRPWQTRSQRAAKARQSNVYTRYGEKAREVLNALLEKYQDGSINFFDEMELLQVQPLSEIGQPMEIIELFGGSEQYQEAVRRLQGIMYQEAA